MTTSGDAGHSADQRFEGLVRTWRRRIRPFLVTLLLAGVAVAIGGFFAGGQWKLALGIAASMLIGVYIWVHEAPPYRIANWRWGSEGERQTARVLKRLPSTEWHVWHDLGRADGSNIDHVVVAESGIFLLDTKNAVGRITVDQAGLHFEMPEDPDVVTLDSAIFKRIKATSADLKERIQEATGVRTWVE